MQVDTSQQGGIAGREGSFHNHDISPVFFDATDQVQMLREAQRKVFPWLPYPRTHPIKLGFQYAIQNPVDHSNQWSIHIKKAWRPNLPIPALYQGDYKQLQENLEYSMTCSHNFVIQMINTTEIAWGLRNWWFSSQGDVGCGEVLEICGRVFIPLSA